MATSSPEAARRLLGMLAEIAEQHDRPELAEQARHVRDLATPLQIPDCDSPRRIAEIQPIKAHAAPMPAMHLTIMESATNQGLCFHIGPSGVKALQEWCELFFKAFPNSLQTNEEADA